MGGAVNLLESARAERTGRQMMTATGRKMLAGAIVGLLASALGYQSTGVCPVAPSGTAAPPALATAGYVPPAAQGQAVKSLWQQNRILRRPASH